MEKQTHVIGGLEFRHWINSGRIAAMLVESYDADGAKYRVRFTRTGRSGSISVKWIKSEKRNGLDGLQYYLTEPVTMHPISEVFVDSYKDRKWIPFDEWLEGYMIKDLGVRGRDQILRARVDFRGEQIETFAKSWSRWDVDEKDWVPVRVGLGAYGDTTAWQRHAKAVN